MDKKLLIKKINIVRDEIKQSFEKQFIDFDKIESELSLIVTELDKTPEPENNLSNAVPEKQATLKKPVMTSDFS